MNIPVLRQGDLRWGKQRLGTQNGITIASDGCGVTCVTMCNQGSGDLREPNNIDDVFTNQGGYVGYDAGGTLHRAPWQSGNYGCALLDWSMIGKLLPNTTVAKTGGADIASIISWINSGQPVILEVRWHGAPTAMHFVVAVDHNGNDIIVNDPETGARQAFSSRLFGTGNPAIDIKTAHYMIVRSPVAAVTAAPALIVEAQEVQVTQAQNDAAIAAAVAPLNAEIASTAAQLATATAMVNTQANTISTMTAELLKYKPEWEVTYKPYDDGKIHELLTAADVIIVDFTQSQPPVEIPADTILETIGTFTNEGKLYHRTAKSAQASPEYCYGVADSVVSVYTSNPATATSIAAAKAALTAAQQVHEAAAASVSGWKALLNKIGVK